MRDSRVESEWFSRINFRVWASGLGLLASKPAARNFGGGDEKQEQQQPPPGPDAGDSGRFCGTLRQNDRDRRIIRNIGFYIGLAVEDLLRSRSQDVHRFCGLRRRWLGGSGLSYGARGKHVGSGWSGTAIIGLRSRRTGQFGRRIIMGVRRW